MDSNLFLPFTAIPFILPVHFYNQLKIKTLSL